MKFLQKFYSWSLIIIIPLVMGSYIRGCNIFGLLLFCYNNFNVEYNDEAYYDSSIFGQQYIFVSDSGKIWHGTLQEGCVQQLFSEFQGQTSSNLNRIEYFAESNLMIVVGEGGDVLREDDPEIINSWDLMNSQTDNDLYGLCQSGSSIFSVGDSSTVIKSDDLGLTWELLNFPYSVDLRDCSSPVNGEVICVGTEFYAAYRTTDYGDTWKQINFGALVLDSLKSKQVAGLHRVYYFDNQISYIVGSDLVFRTNDNWNTSEFQNTDTFESLNDVFFISPDSGTIIGDNGTARFTYDGGQSWFEDPDVTTALNGTTLKRIKKQGDDFGIVVGEGGLSIMFARDLSVFTAVEPWLERVTEYSLSQNYPNPFNPVTTIKYSIQSVGTSLMQFVQLKVYDLLGNEVATLVNEEKPAGSYEVNFNASQLSSGIYFYTLEAGTFIETKKLILMK